jgi:hypothetical protein
LANLIDEAPFLWSKWERPPHPSTRTQKDVTMRFLLASLCLIAIASAARAADIGSAGPGYPVEIKFLAPITTGVSARAFGDVAWTPLAFSGNTASFTIQGNAGLNMQVWNQDRPYYFQAADLNFMASDYTSNLTTFTELSAAFPGTDNFDLTVTGPTAGNRLGKIYHREFATFVVPPAVSIPEPSAGLLACLAIPFLRIARRYA